MTTDGWDDVTTTLDRRTREIEVAVNEGRLIELAGPEAGRVYRLRNQVEIGRSSDAAVQVATAEVSRRHARIGRDSDGHWMIEDLGSRNGTLVNGQPLRGRPHALRFGDRIQIGNTALFVFSRYDRLEDQVLQAQRMEAVGRLAGGVAHDFNNLLSAIASTVDYIDYAKRDGTLGDEALAECIGDMRQATKRAVELTSSLLDFSRGDQGVPEAIDLSALVTEVVQLARRTFSDRIAVEAKVSDSELLVMGNRSQLHQAMMNLCVNARDAMESEGGKLVVGLRRVDKNAFKGLSVPFLPQGSYVMVSVADSGTGMDEETLSRVFEPFFTTKAPERGTGLGLATVYGVVKNHGGHCLVESELGRGSTFRLYLPALKGRMRDASGEFADHKPMTMRMAKPDVHPGQGDAILIVDDDLAVRRSVSRLLRQLDYEVMVAGSGKEAIETFQRQQAGVRLVLLDVVLPDMEAEEIFHRIRELSPYLPILLMSGYAPQGSAHALMREGASGFLRKPFDAQALWRSIAEALGGGLDDEDEATVEP